MRSSPGAKRSTLTAPNTIWSWTPVAVAAGAQTDLEEQGIAKNARQEKLRARAERVKEQQENERLAALYRQHILKGRTALTAGPDSGAQEGGDARAGDHPLALIPTYPPRVCISR